MQCLTAIELLIQDGRYTEAKTELDHLDCELLPTEERGLVSLMRSEVQMHLGIYDLAEISRAVEVFRHSVRTDLFARSKYQYGRLLSLLGRHAEAEQALVEAFANYLRIEDDSRAAAVKNRMAYDCLKTGRLERARENLQQSLQTYERLGDLLNCTKTAHNLATVLCLQGHLKASLRHYQSCNAAVASERVQANCYNMSSLPHALLGDLSTARQTITQATPFLDTYPREKAIYHENLGLIEILAGNYEAAEASLQAGLDISLKIAPESALVSQIKRLFGDLYIATEDWDKAEQYGQEALAVAEQINERLEIAACWRVFAQIDNHRGNHDKARDWFEKAIDLLNLIGVRYELALTRYLAGTSGLYTNGARSALLSLAKEYFSSENVTPYLTKINAFFKAHPPLPPRRPTPEDPTAPPLLLYRSTTMGHLVEFATYVAPSDMAVLLTGETGTGKDLLARYIHYHSGRPGRFVTMNTAAVPAEIVEAELFGHARGAYTGADIPRTGLVENANNGTLYLNEIADSTPAFQAKLLDVLETHLIRPLGQNQERPVTFRLIAATNRDLPELVRQNIFRSDLFHRLNQIPIHLPPLRERLDDLPLLIAHFLAEVQPGTDLAVDACIDRLTALCRQRTWPGNVRQLCSVLHRLLMEARGDLGRLIELAATMDLDDERERLVSTLKSTGGNKSQAARLLGVSETAIRKRARKYRLDCAAVDRLSED